MKTIRIFIILVAMILCSITTFGQNADFYKQQIEVCLSKGDCDKAQIMYDAWRELSGRSDTSIEERIEAYKKTKDSANTLTEYVEINGVKWATRNVDTPGTFAEKSEDTGMYYQWNRRTGIPATGRARGWKAKDALGDKWEKHNDPCPEGWRVPTDKELWLLVDGYNEWTTVNGVSGRRFGRSSQTIFFPASGCRTSKDGTITDPDKGYYWSSTTSISSRYGYCNELYFDYNNATRGSCDRQAGFSIRCVQQ